MSSLGHVLSYDEAYPEDALPPGGDIAPREVAARRSSWTAAELLAETFPEPRWAVPGLVAEGVTLFAGAPKLGKSWLALNIGLSVASGGKALGSIDVDKGDVLYLALEDTARRLQSRLRTILGPDPAPPRLRLATECAPLHAGGTDRIRGWLERHPDARLVIVDVFTRIRGAVSDKANRYEADYSAMAAVKAIADEYSVAIVAVHHTRKAAAEDYLETVSGSQGLAGAADAIAVLTRSRGKAQAILKVTGRDIEEAEHALDFDAATGTWRVLEGPASDYEQSDERRKILTVLRDAEGLGPKAIAEAAGLSHDVVKHLVRKMATDGKLDTDGTGRYFPALRSPHSPRSPDTDDPQVGRTLNGEHP